MIVAELIEKLSKVDPTLLVCDIDGESGLSADISVIEQTAYVDRSAPYDHPFIDSPSKTYRTDLNERVIVITRWGHNEDEPDKAVEL
ncbi:hypothetical protein [Mycolicibacterium komossense]|uniref:Uncharacterized protein n=1 Tax=Mycolicibacterium komossense TaxID=1779 RepID=A0ABT3CMA2_9MYCO|nr:hypothetical protein [Mycolicibacterium komossense]MCV7230684.1 hypothetical protein [Mycolicibacterium komossense]